MMNKEHYYHEAEIRKNGVPVVSFYNLQDRVPEKLHYHKVLELGICHSGNGICYIEDKEQFFQAGDAQIILPGVAHFHKANMPDTYWSFANLVPEAIRTVNLQFPRGYLTKLMNAGLYGGILTIKDNPELVSAISSFITYAKNLQSRELPLDDECVSRFLSLLFQLTHREQLSSNLAGTNLRIEEAITYIKKTVSLYPKPLTVANLAKIMKMSEGHLRHLFLQGVGISPKEYILDVQLGKSVSLLLKTDLPISVVAEQSCFADVSTFFRNFEKKYGMSPTEYRKRYTKNENISEIS